MDAEAKVQQLQCRIEDKEAVLRERDLHIQSLQQQLEQQEVCECTRLCCLPRHQ